MSTLKRYTNYLDDHVQKPESGEWVRFEEAHAIEEERDTLKAENEILRKDKERLDWFESEVSVGGCPALVFDDNKFWAVSTEGIQTSITGDLPKDYEASIYVEAKAQRETVREAIDVAMQEEE